MKYMAWVTVCDGKCIWPVMVYSVYESIEDANRGLEEFCATYANSRINVIGTTIEPVR